LQHDRSIGTGRPRGTAKEARFALQNFAPRVPAMSNLSMSNLSGSGGGQFGRLWRWSMADLVFQPRDLLDSLERGVHPEQVGTTGPREGSLGSIGNLTPFVFYQWFEVGRTSAEATRRHGALSTSGETK